MIGKFVNAVYMASIQEKWDVLFFYFLNFIMVSIDFSLYFRNRRLANTDKAKV